MNKTILVLVFLAFANMCKAQLMVGTSDALVLNGKEIDPGTMRNFKKSTTVFFYNEKDKDYYEGYGDQIKRYWNVNELIFVPVSESEQFSNNSGNYSFLTYEIRTTVKTMKDGTPYVAAMWVYLDLIVPGRDAYDQIARVVLGPDIQDLVHLHINYLDDLSLHTTWFDEDLSDESRKNVSLSQHYLYKEGSYTNFYPGIFTFYLKQISEKLESGETCGVLSGAEYPELLSSLTEKKLFVPEGILDKWNKLRQEWQRQDEQKFFEKYDYSYELKSIDELNKLMLEGRGSDEEFVLVPAISNSDQYLNIYTTSGKLVYKDMNAFSRKYKSKHMKRISKAIKKAAKR